MATRRTSKPAAKSAPPKKRRRWAPWAGHLVGAMFFVSLIVGGTVVTRRYVDQQVAAPTGPLRVVIKDKPVWMSDFLAQQIAQTVPRESSSSFDRGLLETAAKRLEVNPWVCNVRSVRRVYGDRPGDTLEIDCAFRAPIALVQWGNYYWLVDGEGVKLPEQFTAAHVPMLVVGRDGHTNIRVIQGVRQPPPRTGQSWSGQDLADGLGLTKVLYGKAYADALVAVDVTNDQGRVDPREPQLICRTKELTEVRWGRPVDAEDALAEVPAEQKLDELRRIVKQYGRVDAGQPWVDLRYDKITYPTAPPSPPYRGVTPPRPRIRPTRTTRDETAARGWVAAHPLAARLLDDHDPSLAAAGLGGGAVARPAARGGECVSGGVALDRPSGDPRLGGCPVAPARLLLP